MKSPFINPNQLSPAEVYTHLGGVLYRHAPEFADRYCILVGLVSVVMKDVEAYVSKDPAAKSRQMVFHEYLAFKAVIYYRVAHALLNSCYDSEEEKTALERAARRISEAAKVLSGVEIHPNAKIGEAFVIDHGYGVVIGETTEIGHNVTILNGVVLGARKAAGNIDGKRHPTIGNHVEIGVNAKILGPIKIGSFSCIGADAKVTEDILPFSRIVVKSNIQLTKLRPKNGLIYPLLASLMKRGQSNNGQ